MFPLGENRSGNPDRHFLLGKVDPESSDGLPSWGEAVGKLWTTFPFGENKSIFPDPFSLSGNFVLAPSDSP